jgi:thiamine-monophosphate kinase
MAGEFEFIEWLRAQQRASARQTVPLGDDLAALHWDEPLILVGVDQVLDGVHFDSAVHSPRQIGAKVMNRNLSDCAAMACLPAAAVATAALPRTATLEYAKELYLGMRAAGEAFDCPIVGGDTASWDGRLAVTLTIIGRGGGIKPVTRSGARIGDAIYVTGPLGGSLLGRHMGFTPRIREARELAGRFDVSAMIDISDGLSRDLGHICRHSGVGAIVDAAAIPIHADAVTMSKRDGRTALEHALHDGEDHELLFAATPDSDIPATRIGTIAAGREVLLKGESGSEPLVPKGWEHRLASEI